MAWHPDWFRLPGQAVFDREKQHVAAVTRAPCFIDLFAIRPDNRVWSSFWTEERGWNPEWFPVPGTRFFNRDTQQVTAISRHAGHLDLFVIGFDNRVWTTFWSEARGGWNEDWFLVPGDAVFAHEKQLVTAVSRHRDQLDLFAIRSDNRVWTTYWNQTTGWYGVWFPVRGQAVFDHERQRVAAISRAPGQIDLFAIRTDNHVWTTFWSEGGPDGGWNPDWFPVRGAAVFDHEYQHVTALSRKPGQIDLFAIRSDQRVCTTFWNEGGPDGGWNPDWFPVNGQPLFDFQKQRVAAVSRHHDQLDVFAIGPGNRVLTTFWTEGRPWHPEWFPVPGLTEFDREKQHVAAVSRAPAQLDLFAIDSDNKVSSTFWGQFYEPVSGDYLLDVVPADGSPAQAYATHKARASAVARNFASRNPLKLEDQTANEDNTIHLIAHLQAASDDPNFSAPGHEISKTLAPKVLLKMNPGHAQVGTHYDEFFGSREGDYDMALKGLMVIAYRYQGLVGKEGLDYILDRLTPLSLSGPHDEDIESYSLLPLVETAPETENHVLMITSTRYLVNQLLHDRVPLLDTYDNNRNGLTRWLLGYLQRVAKHDFLEFNSRIYQRLSLHALLNLHEFARDKSIRTAAQILLDYSMVKFAISSNRLRRVNPFRRKKENTNTPDKLDDLINEAGGGDQLLGFFLTYVGPAGPDGQPLDRFPEGWGFNAVIAGLAAYRPPPAAYALALLRDLPPFQHRFYHGNRPRLPGTDDDAQGGIEIYYRSPSFLLTAGGAFLNSGYGGDEFTGQEIAVAQSTTLIPTRANLAFADLIRFDPYPDERRATNTGVHLGFACGANLRPSDRKYFDDRSTHSPRLAAHRGRLLLAWKASGSEEMVVATVRITDAMGLDGIEQIHSRVVPRGDTTDTSLAVASHACRLFLASKGAGNENLNLMFSDDGGATFHGKRTFEDTTDCSPALASHAGHLFMAWTGEDESITVAKVSFQGNTAGTFAIDRLESKVTLGETSEHSPALASHHGRLFLAWRGSGNEAINLAFSDDGGVTFGGKVTLAETSELGPALASHNGRLYLAWTGEGDDSLNVARMTLVGSTAGGFLIEGLESKVTLAETSDDSPTLTSHAGRLFLGWKGHGNTGLNVRSSRDGTFHSGPWYFSDLSHLGFYVAAYRTPPEHPELLDTFLESLGFVYAMENQRAGMTFEQFRAETLVRNPALPAMLDYGSRYEFNAPDGRQFVFRVHPSLSTYEARVALTNEPHPVIDFTTLPLIEGPYLRAPGGHDGLIEVHDPRCPTPLILDYRDAMNPKRHDPLLACAGTWVERAEALADLADHLIAAGKHRYADATLIEQVKVFKHLAQADRERHGASLAAAVHAAVRRAGVDFSVTAGNVNEWVSSPRLEPQLAISEALLVLLGGRSLRRSVDLNAIVDIYTKTPDVHSPRDEGSVQAITLKAAVVEAYNLRYAEVVSELDALLR